MRNPKSKIHLTLSSDEEFDGDEDDDFDELEDVIGYLTLPNHPGRASVGCVSKSVRLFDLYPYKGEPDIYLDFDSENRLIGIEIA